MGYLPLTMNLAKCPCVVLGGGEVATKRVEFLVDGGAIVDVVSPAVTRRIADLAESGRLRLSSRRYRRGDLNRCRLAFDATNDEKVHQEVGAEAARRGVLLNVADRPALCTFIMPAIVKRGGLMIAVSTGGRSPAFSARMRRELERRFGREYGTAVDILGRVRRLLSDLPNDERKRRLRRLADSSLPSLLDQGDTGAIDRLLAEAVAEDCSLAKLGIVTGG